MNRYSIAFLYGAQLVRDGEMDGQDIIIVLFTTMVYPTILYPYPPASRWLPILQIGLMGFGQAISHFQRLVLGKVAAYDIFAVIDRKSKIDGLSTEGKAPSDMQGVVELHDVHFAYPSAPEEKVLKGEAFRKVALLCATCIHFVWRCALPLGNSAPNCFAPGLSISVKRGETLAICGPSGSGKSTVVNLVER